MDTERIIYHLRSCQSVLNETWVSAVRKDRGQLERNLETLMYCVREALAEIQVLRREAA